MTLEEWAKRIGFAVSYPNEIPALKGPSVGFYVQQHAQEVCEEMKAEGLNTEVILIPDGDYDTWYVTKKE